MRALLILLCYILLGSYALAQTSSTVATTSERVALVIGNSNYRFAGQLINPKNDANDIAKAFEAIGFRVIKGTDLDKAAMDRTIRKFARALSRAKTGVFFYAGHGIQVAGQNYLIPVDAKLEDPTGIDFELIRADIVQRAMELATRTNLIFLDACRNNPLARNLARAMGTRSTSIGRGLASIESGAGTIVSFATQPGNVALDGKGRNSPYTKSLLRHLATPGEDISSILIWVRNSVMQDTQNKQVPWEHSALRARFYFVDPPQSNAVKVQRSTAPPTAPMSAAARAWSVTKDSKSVAILEEFARHYPKTVYAALAGVRVKELNQQNGANATSELARSLQTELKRVGCYIGTVDGNWGTDSKSALDRFSKSAGLQSAGTGPTTTALAAVKAETERACRAAEGGSLTGRWKCNSSASSYPAMPLPRNLAMALQGQGIHERTLLARGNCTVTIDATATGPSSATYSGTENCRTRGVHTTTKSYKKSTNAKYKGRMWLDDKDIYVKNTWASKTGPEWDTVWVYSPSENDPASYMSHATRFVNDNDGVRMRVVATSTCVREQ